MRVLVVDDSAFMRKTLTTMLGQAAGIEVVGAARDGLEALALLDKLHPDVMTLDVEMPTCDGIETLRRLQHVAPEKRPAVIMCSSLTHAGSHAALQAMKLGAADVVAKDASVAITGLDELKRDLVEKIRALAPKRRAVRMAAASQGEAHPTPSNRSRHALTSSFTPTHAPDLVIIGSSTGGPPVLERLVTALPKGFGQPVVIAQHMPAMFTKSLADRLMHESHVPVVHCDRDTPIAPGTVHVIVGGKHGQVVRAAAGRLTLRITDEPTDALYRPSVNELFRSSARSVGARCLGVMLTGMGDDGLVGSRELHSAGGSLIAQDEESCVVWGMPRAITEAGLAHAVMTPADIGRALASLRSPLAKAG